MRYLPLADRDRQEMLRAVGASSIDDLFVDVPEAARLSGKIKGLADHASELSVERQLGAMARANMVAGEVPFFLGCGRLQAPHPGKRRPSDPARRVPDQLHALPAGDRPGHAAGLFEFQTQVARLYGCDVANASMYDGSTACWEAITMARRITRRGKAVISSGLHPHYVSVAKTMARFTGDQLDVELPVLEEATDAARLIDRIDGDTSCVVFQYPDVFGRCGDLSELAARAHEKGALLIAVVTEPVALGLIKSPGEMGADIVVGEGQSLGVGLQFGGPYVGLFACADKYVRQMPGRLAGHDKRRGREARLRADAVDPRAAYPPREGDVQHLHQLGPVRARLHHPHDAAGRGRGCGASSKPTARPAAGRGAGAGVEWSRDASSTNSPALPKEARPVVRAWGAGVLGGVSLGRLYPGAGTLAERALFAVTETSPKMSSAGEGARGDWHEVINRGGRPAPPERRRRRADLTGNRALMLEEPLIFEMASRRPGRFARPCGKPRGFERNRRSASGLSEPSGAHYTRP
jgi:glycine dehydrogenase subunit 1